MTDLDEDHSSDIIVSRALSDINYVDGFNQSGSINIVPEEGDKRTIVINSTLLNNIGKGNVTINEPHSNGNSTNCNTLYGSVSEFLGILQETPCTIILSNIDKEIKVDFDIQIIKNDDTHDITEFYNHAQEPENITLTPGEVFVMSRVGGDSYDSLNVYLIDHSIGIGQIIGLGSSDFVRISMDRITLYDNDYFVVPNIYDYDSDWDLVIAYSSNDELVSYFIADNIKIQ